MVNFSLLKTDIELGGLDAVSIQKPKLAKISKNSPLVVTIEHFKHENINFTLFLANWGCTSWFTSNTASRWPIETYHAIRYPTRIAPPCDLKSKSRCCCIMQWISVSLQLQNEPWKSACQRDFENSVGWPNSGLR